MTKDGKCVTVNDLLTKYYNSGMEKSPQIRREQIGFYRTLWDIHDRQTRLLCVLFVLMKNNRQYSQMFNSILKQRRLLESVSITTKTYKLRKDELPIITSFINNLTRRCEHIERITECNIAESEYFPYWKYLKDSGSGIFDECYTANRRDINDVVKVFLEDARKYNTEHETELKPFFEELDKKKTDRELLLKARKQHIHEEKAKMRAAEKVQRDEIKEMDRNARAYKNHDRLLGHAGDYYHYM